MLVNLLGEWSKIKAALVNGFKTKTFTLFCHILSILYADVHVSAVSMKHLPAAKYTKQFSHVLTYELRVLSIFNFHDGIKSDIPKKYYIQDFSYHFVKANSLISVEKAPILIPLPLFSHILRNTH